MSSQPTFVTAATNRPGTRKSAARASAYNRSQRAFVSILTSLVPLQPIADRASRHNPGQSSGPQPAVSWGVVVRRIFNRLPPRRMFVVGLLVLFFEHTDNTVNALLVLCILRATALFFLCCDDCVSYQSSPLRLEPLALPISGLRASTRGYNLKQTTL